VHAPGRLTRIGIDGVDGAGKTSLAEEIAQLLTGRARPCVRVSLDFFERLPAERYARGKLSPEGYYLDAFDVGRLREHVLSIGGPPELVVVVDGIFLHRPELVDLWDASVWVDADLEAAADRARARDSVLTDSLERELERYRRRYFPAQRRYIDEQRPHERATFVLQNTGLTEPELVRRPRPR
jgi:uridine kinase